jgi:hypothetical protein
MPSRLEVAAELHLGEKSTCQAQDLVCLAQLAHFPLERLDAILFAGSPSWTLAGIALLLAYPAAQCLWRTADLSRNRRDRGPLQLVLVAGFAGHAHGALDDFGGVLRLLFHGSILSNNGASTKPRAIHLRIKY